MSGFVFGVSPPDTLRKMNQDNHDCLNANLNLTNEHEHDYDYDYDYDYVYEYDTIMTWYMTGLGLCINLRL